MRQVASSSEIVEIPAEADFPSYWTLSSASIPLGSHKPMKPLSKLVSVSSTMVSPVAASVTVTSNFLLPSSAVHVVRLWK